MNETLHEAAQAYLEHLKAQGKKERTIYTYTLDFQQIESFFGPDKKLTSIQTPQVGKFLKSDALLKMPNGKDRAERTVQKTVRIFRMFLVWAEERNLIETLPLPKDTPMGRSVKKGEDANAE